MTATARTTALQVLCAMKRADAWADAALKAQITADAAATRAYFAEHE